MSAGRRAITKSCIREVTIPRLLLVLPLLLAGCSDPTGLNGHDVRRVGAMHSRPAWSLDSHTIFYTDRVGSGVTTVRVHALNAASGNSKELASVAALNHVEQVRTTNDASFVYVAIAQPNWSLQLNLYSIPTSGGTAQTIATNVGTPWFVASRDGGKVAYQGSRYDADTIYVASTSTQTNRVRFPSAGQRPRMISISPNGARLIYESTTGVFLTRTDGSDSAQAISLSTTTGSRAAMASQVVWSDDVPHLLVAEQTSQTADSLVVRDLDAVSGNRSQLAILRKIVPNIFFWQLARSEDGRAFAVFVPIAIVDSNVERTTYRFGLYVKGPADSEPVAAMELTGDEPLTWFEFSPDNRQLALVLRGSLYLVEVD